MLPPEPPRLGESPAPPAPGPLTLYDTLHGHIDEVISEWKSLLALAASPAGRLPPARLVDALPVVLPKIFQLADQGAPYIGHELSDEIADKHGFWRRDDGVPIETLAEEWALLKRASRTVLARYWPDMARVDAALGRLDLLIDDAVGFSLRGYYQPELDELRGRGLERRAGETEDRRGQSTDRRQGGNRRDES